MITTDQIEQLKKRIAKVCDEFITGIEKPAEFIQGRMYRGKNTGAIGIYYPQSNGLHCGFNEGEFIDFLCMKDPSLWTLLSPEEQLQIMSDYAVNKLGLKEGVRFKSRASYGEYVLKTPLELCFEKGVEGDLHDANNIIVYHADLGQWATPIQDKLIIQGHEVIMEFNIIWIGKGVDARKYGTIADLKELYRVLTKYNVLSFSNLSFTLTIDEIKSIIEWDKW